MLNTVVTIVDRVEDPTSIIKAANATDSITSNKEQMPTKNQEASSTAMETMGQRAKTFGATAESGVVVELATVLLGATSNVLGAACETVPVSDDDFTDPQLLVSVTDRPSAPL